MTRKAPNPYRCHKDYETDRIFYEFQTDQNIRYRAYFSDYGYMFGTHTLNCRFYSFDLVVIGALRPPRFTPVDNRIADTVRGCFAEIFQSLDNVIIAAYDSTDKGEFARQRKFNAWFNEADDAFNHIEKVDFNVATEDYTLLTSVFLYTDLPEKEEVLATYQLILEGGNIPLA